MKTIYGLMCDYKGVHWFDNKEVVDHVCFHQQYASNCNNPCAVLTLPDDVDLGQIGIVLRSEDYIKTIKAEMAKKERKASTGKSARKKRSPYAHLLPDNSDWGNEGYN